MSRYILRFVGQGPCPHTDLETLRTSEDLKILDESGKRMFLVEADEADLRPLVDKMPGWVLTLEKKIALPDVRPKIRHPFSG